MPIDPAGTTPGLTTKVPEAPPKLHMRCKTPTCASILAIEIKYAGHSSNNRLYQCCECKRTWGIAVGGAVDW